MQLGKHRVYTDQQLNSDSTLTICGEDAWHMAGVLRLGAGDTVTLCDGAEHECEAEITNISKQEAALRLGTVKHTATEPSVRVTLYQSLPKADKMELIIQKCVEIGTTGIIPVMTSRSIPGKPGNDKIERWQKIAKEAARQSGRGIIPHISQPLELKKLKNYIEEHGLFLIAYEDENDQTLASVLNTNPDAKSIGIFIGPEGGISPDEVQLLKNSGGRCVSLGKRILRTETAGLAMLSAILYAYGEMG